MKFQALRASAQAMYRSTSKSVSLLALSLAASLTLPAQQPAPSQLQDPANLAGERVAPQDLADNLPIDHGAPALQQLLRKLRTRASFMLIVAHPDDEDGGMLTYLSRGQGARVAMLTLTRGEGGQNLMSADFDDALGLIRTQELLAADRYMAVDQFFGTEVDFGFSKTKEESFAKWTHERVLYDAVRAVRLYRPLVVASVFIGAPSDGHGHHQVSGEIAQEVFNAAGDPSVFPDQIAAGLEPWQPLKVYARVPFARIDAQGMFDYATNQYTPARFTNYVTGKVTETIPKANVVIPEGTPDDLLGGLSYIQFAREGLGLQKTQIGHNTRLTSSGPHDVSYHRYGSRLNQPDGDDSGLESSVFDGIDTSVAGIATLAPDAPPSLASTLASVSTNFAAAQQAFQTGDLKTVASALYDSFNGMNCILGTLEDPHPLVGLCKLPETEQWIDLPAEERASLKHEILVKYRQTDEALALALGLQVDAVAESGAGDVALGQPMRIAVRVTTTSTEPLTKGLELVRAELVGAEGPQIQGKHPDTQLTAALPFEGVIEVPATATEALGITRPYFTRPNIEQPFYDLLRPELRDAPQTPAPLLVSVNLYYRLHFLRVFSIVHDRPQPIVVVPRLSISISPAVRIVPTRAANRTPFNFKVEVRSNVPNIKPRLELNLPPAWTVTSPEDDFALVHVNDAHISKVSVVPSVMQSDQGDGGAQVIQAYALEPKLGDTAETNLGYRSVGYPGLPQTNLYRPANLRVVGVDVTTAPSLNIAYLPGTGDDVPSALEDLGVHVRLVTVADLTADALEPYDAVVLGVRAYEAHPDLAAANPALNSYAASGGVVIAQYNTGRLPEGTSPYPLNLGDGEKVVEEQAPVRLLAPDDPLLTWPNRITPADFDGWVEERGHGFMGTWDSHYQPLLETHDPGQQPQLGGLLVAHTSKGAWIYLGLALYRQLPEGVPGPYRLLANLISAAKNPAFRSTPAPAK